MKRQETGCDLMVNEFDEKCLRLLSYGTKKDREKRANRKAGQDSLPDVRVEPWKLEADAWKSRFINLTPIAESGD